MIASSLLVIYSARRFVSFLMNKLFSSGSCDDKCSDISARAKELLNDEDLTLRYLSKCLEDPFDPVTNQNGYVNFGTSVSTLCDDILLKRLNEPGIYHYETKDLHYFPLWGTQQCREAIANCLTRVFSPDRPLHPDNVLVMNGGTAAMEALACYIFDAGDVLLTPSPCYTRIFRNFNERFQVEVVDLFLRQKNTKYGEVGAFELTSILLEDAIKEEIAKGKKVKGFMLVNPNNPLGEVYSPELVVELLFMCHKYDIHFICNEIYSMTIYEPGCEFQSVINLKPLPNPKKTHVIWAVSKDINMSGMRLGALITWNEELIQVVKNCCLYNSVPAIAQKLTANVLNDPGWVQEVFLPTHRQRLRESALKVRDVLGSLGIHVRPSSAAFFLWADMRPYMNEISKDGELALFEELLKHKIYIIPSFVVHCKDPGWFRIVFSVKPDILDEGLKRITSALKGLSRNRVKS